MEETEIKVEILGGEDPEYGVIACVHGNEECGYEAIQRFKRSEHELEEAVKFVIANEKARKQGIRYMEKDLNRCFPGDPESNTYEKRLAAELLKEIEDLTVLDLHSTFSRPTPFAFYIKDSSIELVKSTGVERAVDLSYMPETLMNYTNSVVVECGHTAEEEAAENAYKILVNFLAAEGILEAEYEKSDPELYEIYDEVMGEGYLFTKKNFKGIKKGEEFAFRKEDGDQKIAEEDFIPILMSDKGYAHKIGYKGRKIQNTEM